VIYAETFTPPEQNSEYKRTIKAFMRNNGTGNEGAWMLVISSAAETPQRRLRRASLPGLEW